MISGKLSKWAAGIVCFGFARCRRANGDRAAGAQRASRAKRCANRITHDGAVATPTQTDARQPDRSRVDSATDPDAPTASRDAVTGRDLPTASPVEPANAANRTSGLRDTGR